MNFIIVVISMLVHTVFLYKREWLFNKRIFMFIFSISTLFFLLGYFLVSAKIGNPKFTPALKMPLLALAAFFVMSNIFFKVYNKNPQDTFWSNDTSLMRDGIFNFLFWFFGTMIPMFLIYYVGL